MPDRPRGPLRPSGPPLGGDRPIAYRKPRRWWHRHLSAILAVGVTLAIVAAVVAAVLVTRSADTGDAGDVALSLAPSASSSAPASPSPSTSPSPTPSPTASTTKATGTVKAVIAAGRWTVAVQAGLDLTVVSSSATTFGKDKSAADVKVGTSISVTGTLADGVITARTVTIEKKSSS